MTEIKPGLKVEARDIDGVWHERTAVSPIVDGRDFSVVWLCFDRDYRPRLTYPIFSGPDARRANRPELIWPWPAEDVRLSAALTAQQPKPDQEES